MRTLVSTAPEKVNQEVTVQGWVHSRRDHGGLIFVDLRDHSGVLQLVIQPEQREAFALAETLRDEFVVSATGQIKERDESLKNPNIATGSIELVATELRVLNRSEPLPIPAIKRRAKGWVSNTAPSICAVKKCSSASVSAHATTRRCVTTWKRVILSR